MGEAVGIKFGRDVRELTHRFEKLVEKLAEKLG